MLPPAVARTYRRLGESMTRAHRVLIAAGQADIASQLAAACEGVPELQVVATGRSGSAAYGAAIRGRPDIAILTERLTGMAGTTAGRLIRGALPDCRLLLIADPSHHDECDLLEMIDAGARGILCAPIVAEHARAAIRTVVSGGAHFDEAVTETMLQQLIRARRRRERAPDPNMALTSREEEVLVCLARGLTNPEISDELGVSVATARSHVARILQKLQVANRTQAAVYAHMRGLVDVPAP
jgi:DNA-binding NarL/FixJ family response regulator